MGRRTKRACGAVLLCCFWSVETSAAHPLPRKNKHVDPAILLSTPPGDIPAVAFASQLNQNWKDDDATMADDQQTRNEEEEEQNNLLQRDPRAMKDVLQSNDDTFVVQQQPQEFCQGMYMTMFMDGFHWSLLFTKPPSLQCLNYFVQSWRLENAAKFKGACWFTFLLAILVEGLSSARSVVVRSFSAALPRQHAILTLIYAVQSLLGYVLMLVTMSFSIELFLSVIAGLMVGNLLFIKYEKNEDDDYKEDGSSQRSPRHSEHQVGGDYHPETSPLLANTNNNTATAASANLRRRGG